MLEGAASKKKLICLSPRRESETRTGTRAGHSSSCAGVAHGATHFLTFKIYAICVISRSVRPRRAYQTADGPRQLKEAVPGARGSILTPATHWVYTEVPICNRSGARTFYRHCRTTFYRARSGRQRHPRDSRKRRRESVAKSRQISF